MHFLGLHHIPYFLGLKTLIFHGFGGENRRFFVSTTCHVFGGVTSVKFPCNLTTRFFFVALEKPPKNPTFHHMDLSLLETR